jgi:hypothetical protein
VENILVFHFQGGWEGGKHHNSFGISAVIYRIVFRFFRVACNSGHKEILTGCLATAAFGYILLDGEIILAPHEFILVSLLLLCFMTDFFFNF